MLACAAQNGPEKGEIASDKRFQDLNRRVPRRRKDKS